MVGLLKRDSNPEGPTTDFKKGIATGEGQIAAMQQDIPIDFNEVYLVTMDEKIGEILNKYPELEPFQLVLNRYTSLTRISEKDKRLLMLDLRIIAQKMVLMMIWVDFLKIWKQIDLMLDYGELRLSDPVGGWKMIQLTEKRKTVKIEEEKIQKSWRQRL